MFPTFKYTVISMVIAFIFLINVIIQVKHAKSLEKNNMKRFQQDVFKRKDLLKLRKNKDSMFQK